MNDFFTLDKQLCFSIHETAGLFTKLYHSALRPFGLTYPQYVTLLALWEKDGVTLKELGSGLNLGTGTLTPMVARLENNGWVRKEKSKLDERKTYILLEQKAIDQKDHITEAIQKRFQTCHIEENEYKLLMEGLAGLKDKLGIADLG